MCVDLMINDATEDFSRVYFCYLWSKYDKQIPDGHFVHLYTPINAKHVLDTGTLQ